MKLKLFFVCTLLLAAIDAFAFQKVDSILSFVQQDETLIIRADSLKENKMLQEALKYWEFVLNDMKALPQSRIRALSESADIHRLLHHDSLAFLRLSEARNLLKQYKGQFPELENQHLNFLGKYFFHQDKPDSAIKYYRLAEITSEKRKDYILEFQSYKGLGEVYDHQLNNQFAARYYYRKSLQLINEGKVSFPLGEADVLFELTNIERKLGEKEVAVLHGIRAVKVASKLQEQIHSDFIANTCYLVAHLHLERQEYKSAIPYLRKAVALRTRYSGEDNEYNFNLYYPALSHAYEATGKPDSAILLQQLLLTNHERQSPSIDKRSTPSFFLIGDLYIKNKNVNAAKQYVNGYYQYYKSRATTNKKELFKALLLKGDMFTAGSSYDSSMFYYTRAIKLLDKNLAIEKLVEDVREARVSVQAMPMIAAAMQKIAASLSFFNSKEANREQLDLAMNLYEEALDYARYSAIADIPDPTSFHIYNFHQITEEALLVAHQLYELTGSEQYLAFAFEWMENDKLIAIQEESEEALFIHQIGLPDSLRLEKETLNSDISKALTNMEKAESDSAREKFEIELIIGFEKMGHWRYKADTFLRHYHNHSNLFNVAAWGDFQSKSHIHLIEYFSGKKFFFGISNSDSTNYFLKREINRDLEETIYGFLSHFRSTPPQFSQEEFNHYVTTSREVYAAILQPLMPSLPTDKQVIVVPDGILALIPFEALLTAPAGDATGYNDLPYLIHSATFSYITSAAMLLDLPVVLPKHNSQLISFALSKKNSAKDPTSAFVMDELVNSRLYYEGMTFRGKEATKEAFLRLAPRFEILYLLIHGDGVPFPRLEFNKGENDDGESDLYAHELYNLKLPGQLVVLTSTETGMGLLEHGESVVSLVRAFLSAGAGAVIIGLWEAHDEHSKNIVGRFFKTLASGENSMVALQEAKSRFILSSDQLTAHPHNWAELVSYGEPVDVSIHKDRGILIWIIVIFVIFVLGSYISTRREKYINRLIEEEQAKQTIKHSGAVK